jgi:hypothetical protein
MGKVAGRAFLSFLMSPAIVPLWIVDTRLASKAATASGERVWEKDSGGKGTLPGAGATKDGYGYVVGAPLPLP